MEFDPPVINNISEVMPFIEKHKGYTLKNKGLYAVVDYVYNSEDMFNTPIEREFRGLKFSTKTGDLVARPYHKFHNLNEREEYLIENVDFSEPHVILDKLDGSMVHTYFTNDIISGKPVCYLHTRAGFSEVAQLAYEFFRKQPYYTLFSRDTFDTSNTYIFEYVGPNNKIVLNYLKEDLILTAVRNTRTGKYVGYANMVDFAKAYGINYVKPYSDKLLLKSVKDDEEKEGFVVRFNSGFMVKVKSDIYVRKHKSKELTSSAKNLTMIVINNQLDDILPELDKGLRIKVEDYAFNLVQNLYALSSEIEYFAEAHSAKTRKEYAEIVIDRYPKVMHGLLFGVRDGKDSMTLVDNLVRKNCGSSKDLENLFKTMSWTKWTGSFFEE